MLAFDPLFPILWLSRPFSHFSFVYQIRWTTLILLLFAYIFKQKNSIQFEKETLFSNLWLFFFFLLFFCCNFISSSLLSNCLSLLSVGYLIYSYLSQLFFPSWLFLSFSSFTSCCSSCSQHRCCCCRLCWGSGSPWGTPSGGSWLPQPRACFS